MNNRKLHRLQRAYSTAGLIIFTWLFYLVSVKGIRDMEVYVCS